MTAAAQETREYVVTHGSIFRWPEKGKKGTNGRTPYEVPVGSTLKLTKEQAFGLRGKVKLKKVADAEAEVEKAGEDDEEETDTGAAAGEGTGGEE